MLTQGKHVHILDFLIKLEQAQVAPVTQTQQIWI